MSRDDIGVARSDGRLPNDDAIAHVVESRVGVEPGSAGMRAIDIRVWGGIDLRLLPDRGLDIGAAWYQGLPLAWVSGVGESEPRSELEAFDWSESFGGGLMVTCGLRNVGMPSEGHGLHGTFSHLPATDVAVVRSPSDDRIEVVTKGRIVDVADPSTLELTRTVTTTTGGGLVEIDDRVVNMGAEPAEAPVLYHFNFGYPLWGPGGWLRVDAFETIPRDEASRQALNGWDLPPAVAAESERVLEHVVTSENGWASVLVGNTHLGIELTLTWRVAELPRLHQWIDPSPGMYVLGIEPANCSTMGRAADRSEGRLPVLAPGEVRETSLRLAARMS